MLKSKVRIGERKKFVKATEVPKVSHALEDYLKSIYQLAEESSQLSPRASPPKPAFRRLLYLPRCSVWPGKVT